MTNSIFDPTGGNAERSGTGFTPPDADQVSQLAGQFDHRPSSEPMGTVGFQPPPERPAIEVSSDADEKVLTIHVSGTLHKDDYVRFLPIVERAFARNGKVRILVQMHDFHGWDAAALWEDVKFDAMHFNRIERLAIVGDKAWEKWMAMFCRPFTAATIRYFPAEQLAAAQAWIAEK